MDVVEESGAATLFETEAISTPAMPLTLHQNHPNPFNPSTTIGYYLPVDAPVTLEVYDSSGRLVARLLDGAKQEKGTHSVEWRGLDAQRALGELGRVLLSPHERQGDDLEEDGAPEIGAEELYGALTSNRERDLRFRSRFVSEEIILLKFGLL